MVVNNTEFLPAQNLSSCVANRQVTNNNIQIDSRKINEAAEDKGIETEEGGCLQGL